MLKNYDFKGFDRIHISGAFDIDIRRADIYSVSIEADFLKPVQVKKTGDTLSVGLPWYYYFWGFLTAWKCAFAVVNLPELRELRVSGAAKGRVDDFNTTHDFNISIAGASRLEIGSIDCGDAAVRLAGASVLDFRKIKAERLDVSIVGASRLKAGLSVTGDAYAKMAGASQLELSGQARAVKLDATGASRAELSGLSVQDANVKLVGASRAKVKLDGRLDAQLAGASDLSWLGNPVMGDIKSVGASQLHRAQV